METQNESASNGRNVDTLHNQDKVFKESFTLFKGGSLDFLDKELTGEVTDILSTEITETTTKKSYSDNALKLSTNIGIHNEWESQVSEGDLIRFGSYNLDLSRMHKIPFTTVIITAKKPSVAQYDNPTVSVKPKIICLKDRDADIVLSEIDRKLKTGEHERINALEVIYLPLYGSKSKKTTAELLDNAIKLAPKVAWGDRSKQHKLQDLLILLAGSFVSDEELNRILEDNMRILEDSPAVRVLEDRGVRKGVQQGIAQGIEQTATNMLRRGRSYHEISEDTGLTADRIEELEKELLAHA